MSQNARLAVGFVVALTAFCGCAAFYPTPPPPVPLDGFDLARFDQVADGVYRSAQPSQEQFRELAVRYHLRSVLKLNVGSDDVPASVQVFQHSFLATSEPSHEDLMAILDDIDRAPKPVLIHCSHGEDRTGLIVALYRLRHGASVETVYTDMMRRGFHPYDGVYRAWLREAKWNAPAQPSSSVAASTPAPAPASAEATQPPGSPSPPS